MSWQLLFEPQSFSTAISATDTSSRTAIGDAPVDEGIGNNNRRVVVIGTQTGDDDVWVQFGDATVTATANAGSLVPGGQLRGFTVPIGATHIAAVTASGTATVTVENGVGF